MDNLTAICSLGETAEGGHEMRKFAAFAVLGIITGCQNAGYIMDTYGKVEKKTVSTAHGAFWVFDRPDAGKIMTTPTPGTMVAPATISGATLGMVKLDPVVQAHRDVAQQWFVQTGRTCEIKTSVEIWRPEYEHTYSCR